MTFSKIEAEIFADIVDVAERKDTRTVSEGPGYPPKPNYPMSNDDDINDVYQLNDWEDTLLAVAEGQGSLPESDEEMVNVDTRTPDSFGLGSSLGLNTQTTMPGTLQSHANSTTRSPSIKYTSTEKYWLNRTYRAYRIQQKAIKEARARKEPFKPTEGIMTHNNMIASFNTRFAGRYVDECISPRPARERHSFGLWSSKYLKEGSEALKGDVPNYWILDKKLFKPSHISLEYDTLDDWDDDEYLGVTSVRPSTIGVTARKRKTIQNHALEEGPEQKKYKITAEDNTAAVGGQGAKVNAQLRQLRRRKYSAPTLNKPSDTDQFRQHKGDFGYSWMQAQGRPQYQEKWQCELSMK